MAMMEPTMGASVLARPLGQVLSRLPIAFDRSTRPDQELRPPARGRWDQLFGSPRCDPRLPGAPRGRQVDHDADPDRLPVGDRGTRIERGLRRLPEPARGPPPDRLPA